MNLYVSLLVLSIGLLPFVLGLPAGYFQSRKDAHLDRPRTWRNAARQQTLKRTLLWSLVPVADLVLLTISALCLTS